MAQRNGRKHSLPAALGRGLVFLLLAALVYVGVVLLDSPEAAQDDNWAVLDDAPVTPLQAAASSDVRLLSSLFGAPLPALNASTPQGEARNTTHDGQMVRMITLQYENAAVQAVRPAAAAPLLLRPGLSLSLRSDITVLRLPAVLASRGNEFCLYFSDDAAAYSFYATAASTEAFLQLAEQLKNMR